MVPFLTLHVADVMSRDPLIVTPRTPLHTVRDHFEAHDYSALPVVEQGRLVGIVSQFDFLGAFLFKHEAIIPPYDDILGQPVATIMKEKPQTMRPDQPLSRVLTAMIASGLRSYPVIDGDDLVGVVARIDIFRGLNQTLGEP